MRACSPSEGFRESATLNELEEAGASSRPTSYGCVAAARREPGPVTRVATPIPADLLRPHHRRGSSARGLRRGGGAARTGCQHRPLSLPPLHRLRLRARTARPGPRPGRSRHLPEPRDGRLPLPRHRAPVAARLQLPAGKPPGPERGPGCFWLARVVLPDRPALTAARAVSPHCWRPRGRPCARCSERRSATPRPRCRRSAARCLAATALATRDRRRGPRGGCFAAGVLAGAAVGLKLTMALGPNRARALPRRPRTVWRIGAGAGAGVGLGRARSRLPRGRRLLVLRSCGSDSATRSSRS